MQTRRESSRPNLDSPIKRIMIGPLFDLPADIVMAPFYTSSLSVWCVQYHQCHQASLSPAAVLSCSKAKEREVTTYQRQQDIINVAKSLYAFIRRGEMKPCNVAERLAEMMQLSRCTVLRKEN
ncbi:hypothetical protein PR048_001642 [Dryococelus australis]|uniref:HTH gntR-type domain-containing protein n=1 Tax=Dryococelus australis TaxID=614101 RepID=A0ABQ9IHY2_9NEOP|nr:hypothetical protein PR048_001642 [Dryococelus australis]